MMVVVLTALSSVSGGLLAYVQEKTKAPIEEQQLKFDKAPAIMKIFKDASNDPLAQRFKLDDNGKDVTFFVGELDGKKSYVALEAVGTGFGGPLGVMVGVDTETDQIINLGVTTSKETPGIGSKAKTDPKFGLKFKGLSINEECKVKDDGGKIDAISGATVTSKGVCDGVTNAGAIYKRLKPKIVEEIKKL